MSSQISSSTLLLSLVVLLLVSPLASANFIYDSCQSTKFHMACYNSLAPYADAIGDDQARLVETAISSILSKTESFFSYLRRQNITECSTSGDPRVVEALNVCIDRYNEVTIELKLANSFIHQRNGYSKEVLRTIFGSDLARSIASALAQEIECKDAWKNAADSPIKADIFKHTLTLFKFTQNAKDLVAAYAKIFEV